MAIEMPSAGVEPFTFRWSAQMMHHSATPHTALTRFYRFVWWLLLKSHFSVQYASSAKNDI